MTQRILLVDDHPRNLLALEAILLPHGYELIRATDGTAALAAVERERPDLVLLDLMMPGMDGIETLTRLRATEHGRGLPVVLVTASTEREHRLKGLEAGADEFLEKPIDVPILLARVRTLLALKESRDALQASRDELGRRNAALEAAQREQRELTAFIVHDLRSPLGVVYTGLDVVRHELGDAQPDLAALLDDARAAAGRLRAMVNDLLTISRMEAASLPLRCETLPVSSVLRGVYEAYRVRAREQGVRLIAPPETSLLVSADRVLLQRVLENLVDNAFRYTPKDGRIKLGLDNDGDVKISVCNDGPSIPEEERSRIFEKFRRGSGEATHAGNAGLGLYFSKRVVEALGGSIGVEQRPSWATSFVIHLHPQSAAAA